MKSRFGLTMALVEKLAEDLDLFKAFIDSFDPDASVTFSIWTRQDYSSTFHARKKICAGLFHELMRYQRVADYHQNPIIKALSDMLNATFSFSFDQLTYKCHFFSSRRICPELLQPRVLMTWDTNSVAFFHGDVIACHRLLNPHESLIEFAEHHPHLDFFFDYDDTLYRHPMGVDPVLYQLYLHHKQRGRGFLLTARTDPVFLHDYVSCCLRQPNDNRSEDDFFSDKGVFSPSMLNLHRLSELTTKIHERHDGRDPLNIELSDEIIRLRGELSSLSVNSKRHSYLSGLIDLLAGIMNPRDASCVWKNIEVEDGQAFFTNEQMTRDYLYCKQSRYHRWQAISSEYPNLKALALQQLQQQGYIGSFVLIDDIPEHLKSAVELTSAFCFKVDPKRTLLAKAIKDSIPEKRIRNHRRASARVALK